MDEKTILVLVTAIGIILLIYFVRKKQKGVKAEPKITMELLWKACIHEPNKGADDLLKKQHNFLLKLDESSKEEILNNLLDIESKSLEQKNPVKYLREKIIQLVDAAESASSIFENCFDKNENKIDEEKMKKFETISKINYSAEDAYITYSISDFKMYLLRSYSGLKYGDVIKDDWFDLYVITSHFVYNNICSIMLDDSKFDGISLILDSLLKQTREKCYNAAIGQSFKNTIEEQKINFEKLENL